VGVLAVNGGFHQEREGVFNCKMAGHKRKFVAFVFRRDNERGVLGAASNGRIGHRERLRRLNR